MNLFGKQLDIPLHVNKSAIIDLPLYQNDLAHMELSSLFPKLNFMFSESLI